MWGIPKVIVNDSVAWPMYILLKEGGNELNKKRADTNEKASDPRHGRACCFGPSRVASGGPVQNEGRGPCASHRQFSLQGYWVGSGQRGRKFTGHIRAIFTKEGGNLHTSTPNRPPVDVDIKDLEIILEDDKVTLTFSNPKSGARYNLELKDGKLVGIARGREESDIELAPQNPTK